MTTDKTETRRGLRAGLALKIQGTAAASMAIVAAALVFTFARDVESLMHADLVQRGEVTALSMAANSVDAIFSFDRARLGEIATAAVRDTPGVAYVLVRGQSGEVLARPGSEQFTDVPDAALPEVVAPEGERTSRRTLEVGDHRVVEIASRIVFRENEGGFDPLGLAAATDLPVGKTIGTVQVGLDEHHLTSRIAGATRRASAIAAVVFALCLVASLPLVRLVTVPLTRLSRAAAGVARGDLEQRVRVGGNDEVAEVAGSFERMVGELRSALVAIRGAATELEQDADRTLASASDQAAAATRQAATLREIAAAIQEIAQMSSQSISHADKVIGITAQAETHAEEGRAAVEEAVAKTTDLGHHVGVIARSVVELSARAERIGEVASTSKDLAQESNVVALNAAIEAARAGEEGRGFAVVAREMRRLSEQSEAAAGQVGAIVGDVQGKMRAAISAAAEGGTRATATEQLAQRAGKTIVDLAQICRDSSAAAREIAVSSTQQNAGVNEIVSALSEISAAATQSAAGTEGLKEVAERLKSVSVRLTQLVSHYRL
jgi:methyl-accepting chemotaxis protein